MNRAIVLLLSLALLACSSGRPSRPGGGEETRLVVDNQGYVDMTIYIVEGGGSRIRLGMATGNMRTTLTIPRRVIGLSKELQFLADPIGSSRTATSQRLFVRPGDRVTLIIPPG